MAYEHQEERAETRFDEEKRRAYLWQFHGGGTDAEVRPLLVEVARDRCHVVCRQDGETGLSEMNHCEDIQCRENAGHIQEAYSGPDGNWRGHKALSNPTEVLETLLERPHSEEGGCFGRLCVGQNFSSLA